MIASARPSSIADALGDYVIIRNSCVAAIDYYGAMGKEPKPQPPKSGPICRVAHCAQRMASDVSVAYIAKREICEMVSENRPYVR
jgi:hypothetical protein